MNEVQKINNVNEWFNQEQPAEEAVLSMVIRKILICLSYVLLIITFPFSLCYCLQVIQEYERCVIFRLGRNTHDGPRGPGLFFILPCIDSMTKLDLRTVTFDVPPQEILTKDSVSVTVDAVVYFKIFDPVLSVNRIADAQFSTRLLAATTLRNILGTKTLQEILQDKESLSHSMQHILDVATDDWGVKVERVEVKDVRLPVNMQRAMATEAEATREARAKVVNAEGEQKASYSLRNAADMIEKSPIAIQLRYLQTLTHIAAEKNSTVIFPIPMELLNLLANQKIDHGPNGKSKIKYQPSWQKSEVDEYDTGSVNKKL